MSFDLLMMKHIANVNEKSGGLEPKSMVLGSIFTVSYLRQRELGKFTNINPSDVK